MKNVFNEILFKLIEDDWMQSTPKEGWRVVLFEAYGLKMRILHLIGPPVCMRIIFVGFDCKSHHILFAVVSISKWILKFVFESILVLKPFSLG